GWVPGERGKHARSVCYWESLGRGALSYRVFAHLRVGDNPESVAHDLILHEVGSVPRTLELAFDKIESALPSPNAKHRTKCRDQVPSLTTPSPSKGQSLISSPHASCS